MLIQTKFRTSSNDGILAFSQPSAVTLYEAGTTIYGQGDASGPLYMVEFGTVRLCRVSADGRRQIAKGCRAERHSVERDIGPRYGIHRQSA